GVGMIHPRMATMLSVVLTDATVEPATLHGLLGPAAARTWDQLSVDGDTSTNDTVFVLASGAAGATPVAAGTREAADLGRAIEAAGFRPSVAAARTGTAATIDPDRLRIAIAGHLVFDGSAGGPVAFDRAAARAAMDAPELLIRLDLGLAEGRGEAFGCDLTETYVIENSEYTT